MYSIQIGPLLMLFVKFVSKNVVSFNVCDYNS
jgi:hypothetical protein